MGNGTNVCFIRSEDLWCSQYCKDWSNGPSTSVISLSCMNRLFWKLASKLSEKENMLVILWRWQGWIWARRRITLQVIVTVPEVLPKTSLSPVFEARFVPRHEQSHLRGTVQVCLSLMPLEWCQADATPGEGPARESCCESGLGQTLLLLLFERWQCSINPPLLREGLQGDMSTAGSSHWSVPNAWSKLTEGSREEADDSCPWGT